MSVVHLSADELAPGALMRRRLVRTGPEDPHSLVCDTVERAWSLVRKQVVNPCSATYRSWAGRLSPRRLSFRICKTEGVTLSVCLPAGRVWEAQMLWPSSDSPPLPHQADAHPLCLCLGAWPLGLSGLLGSCPVKKAKGNLQLTDTF